MALLHNKFVSITGISACVPKRVVKNRENKIFPETDVNAFIKNVGVEETRQGDSELCASDLSVVAAEKLIQDMNIDREDIGIVVFVSQTPDYHFLPNTACIIQDRLNLSKETISFDVPLGCSGYVYGLNIIASYLSSGQIKKGLLLVGDTPSKLTNPRDKSSSMLFGDGAAATILEYTPETSGIHFHLATDGAGYKAIMVPEGGFRKRLSSSSLIESTNSEGITRCGIDLHLDGFDVFSFGITEAPKTVKKLTGHLGVSNDDVDYMVFHQANKMMNEKIRKKLGLEESKVPYSLKHFGNTSSASIPLTMVTAIRENLHKKNNRVILCGFGVGLSWATAYTLLDNLFVSELIEL